MLYLCADDHKDIIIIVNTILLPCIPLGFSRERETFNCVKSCRTTEAIRPSALQSSMHWKQWPGFIQPWNLNGATIRFL